MESFWGKIRNIFKRKGMRANEVYEILKSHTEILRRDFVEYGKAIKTRIHDDDRYEVTEIREDGETIRIRLVNYDIFLVPEINCFTKQVVFKTYHSIMDKQDFSKKVNVEIPEVILISDDGSITHRNNYVIDDKSEPLIKAFIQSLKSFYSTFKR